MQSLVNTYIDFDGTLVDENSSQSLISYLLIRARTPNQHVLALILNSPCAWLMDKILGLATRLTGQDAKLWLVMIFFRTELVEAGEEIFTAVASALHLNPKLAHEYSRPFIIVSLGLQPIAERFVALHPELNCVGIYGSNLAPEGRLFKPVLKKINFKLAYLSQVECLRYYTDYHHEAQVFKIALAGKHRITTLPDTNRNTLYLLEKIS